MRALWLVVFAIGCKGKPATPAAGSARGTAATVAVTDAGAAAAPAAKAVLEFTSESPFEGLALAFDKKVPSLPAISADGTWIADFDSTYAGMPSPVMPVSLVVRRLDSAAKEERIEIVDDKMSEAEEPWADKPPPAATIKTLHERAATVMKRLEGFSSLVALGEGQDDNGKPRPIKVGDYTFSATSSDTDGMALALEDAAHRVVRAETIASYSSDERPGGLAGEACYYPPRYVHAYTDQAKTKLYAAVTFRFHEECTPQPTDYTVWDLAPDDNDLFVFVPGQFDPNGEDEKMFAEGALIIDHTTILESLPDVTGPKEQYITHHSSDVAISKSRDGKTAWGSTIESLAILPQNEKGRDDPYRASTVLAKTPKGWRIIATTWTTPVANATANKDAKAGKLKSPAAFTVDAGDASLRAAFAKLTTDGVDPDAAKRDDLVAIGSAPGERTVGGAVFARGWNAAWKGKTTVTTSIARLAPSGTTGWVAANVELAKGSYKIPFAVFAVFDKASNGQWTLVHIHFSI